MLKHPHWAFRKMEIDLADIKLLDCTLRDGGYYTSWDFSPELVAAYLRAMDAIGADFVELGLRSFNARGFKGGCAYTTEAFLSSLELPSTLRYGAMVNASELISHPEGPRVAIEELFAPAAESRLDLVRVACHTTEFEAALPASAWLKEQGYVVGYNLMQIAGKSATDIQYFGELAKNWPLDVLYFADSLGGMEPDDVAAVIKALRVHWNGELGVHTHDNMGRAMANSLRAADEGVTWIDGTVTGMGRGPGNAKTEALVIELEDRRRKAEPVLTPLLQAIATHFRPLQNVHGWGANSFYHLSGKYGIHPTYVQEMLGDPRYSEEDTLAAIEHLRQFSDSGKFDRQRMEAARNFYDRPATGTWPPRKSLEGRDVLVLGNGPGVRAHRAALEAFIRREKPVVVALNTETGVSADLIDLRAACHPIRLIADCDAHRDLPQPLVTPLSMLPEALRERLADKSDIRDFGMQVQPDQFSFGATEVVTPNSLVISYVLAMCAAGKARRIYMAGFDGYGGGDPRDAEIDGILDCFKRQASKIDVLAITPTRHRIESLSVYAKGGE